MVLALAYAATLAVQLPALIDHTWWSADSASAGLLAQLYTHPTPGQYVVLGDHGWYEALAFDLLTRGLPAHRWLWYAVPVAVWVATLALIGVSAARAFGRYGGWLAVAGLLCLAPAGLMLVFQPTAHTNVLFHAAVLAVVSGWALPRIRTLTLPAMLAVGVLIGAFTGLALAGDAFALAWAVVPFVVAVGVCARRGPAAAAARTLAFALTALTAMLVASILFTAVMHGAGFRVNELAQATKLRFVRPSALTSNVGNTLNELAYLVGGNFLGHRIDRTGYIELASGGVMLLGVAAVLLAVYRSAVASGERQPRGGAGEVSSRLVHLAFWSTCLVVGLLMTALSAIGANDYRYLLGPFAATAALLPVVVARGRDWRLAVGAGLAVMALAGLVRLATRPLPYLATDSPLAQRDLRTVVRFARRYHAVYGYAVYWDAVMISWRTRFAVRLYPVDRCGPRGERYCASYQADSFTAAYAPRRHLRTLFIADARFRTTRSRSWGRPLASQRIGRLTLYAYAYDIADRFPQRPGAVTAVITGQAPPPRASVPAGRASWITF